MELHALKVVGCSILAKFATNVLSLLSRLKQLVLLSSSNHLNNHKMYIIIYIIIFP